MSGNLDYLNLDSLADDLSAAQEGEQAVDLPIERVHPDPNQPRRTRNPKADAELAESIRADRVRQPIIVLPVNEDGIHIIVFGHRRRDCSELAGCPTVPAIIRDMSPEQVIVAQLSENIDREAMTFADEVDGVQRALDLLGSSKKVAKALGKPQTWVSKRAAVAKAPEHIRAFVASGYSTDAEGIYQLVQLHKANDCLAAELVQTWHSNESARVGLREQVAALRAKLNATDTDEEAPVPRAAKKTSSGSKKGGDSHLQTDLVNPVAVLDAEVKADGVVILVTDDGELSVRFEAGVVEALYNSGVR